MLGPLFALSPLRVGAREAPRPLRCTDSSRSEIGPLLVGRELPPELDSTEPDPVLEPPPNALPAANAAPPPPPPPPPRPACASSCPPFAKAVMLAMVCAAPST